MNTPLTSSIVAWLVLFGGFLSSSESAPAQDSKKNPARSVAGEWDSNLGVVTLEQDAVAASGLAAVRGFHDDSPGRRAELRDGKFDPATGVLEFTYFQAWRNVTGTGRFTLASDNAKLSGTYRQPGATGGWNLTRRAAPATPAVVASVPAAATGIRSVAGVWNSKLGRVTLQHVAPAGVGPVVVTGFHDESRDHRAELRDGAFDPATGVLVFAYYQSWREVTGNGRFVLSADSQRLTGTYTQPGATGPWTLERAAQPAVVARAPATPASAGAGEKSGLPGAIAAVDLLLGVFSPSPVTSAPAQPAAVPFQPSTPAPADSPRAVSAGLGGGAIAPPASAVPRGGLVGEWLLAGDTRDTSGRGFDGKVSGGATAAADRFGQPGQALRFNGSDAKLDCGPLPGVNLTKEATFSLWAKWEARPGFWHLAGKAGNSTDLDLIINESAVRFYIAGGHHYQTRGKLPDGQWVHVAASFRAGGKLKIYLNGALDGAIDTGGRGENGNPFTVGESGFWPGRWFKGVLDDVRLYERQLSDAEVAVLAADKGAAALRIASPGRSETLAPKPDATGPVLIKAYIDGRSRMVIRGSQAWWQHLEFDLPGKNGGNDFSTRVRDLEWKPTWREVDGKRESVPEEVGAVFSPTAGQVTLIRRAGRNGAAIIQQPDPANGYTLIIEFNDPEPFADWYEVALEQKAGGSAAAPTRGIVRAPGGHFERGSALLAAGDNAGAIAAFSEAIAGNPQDAEAYRERGRAYSRAKKFRAATGDLDQAIRLNARDAVTFNLRGIARKQLGDAAGAEADYSQAIELDPQYLSPLANRGALRHAANDFAGARQDYDRALAVAPRDENTLWRRGDLKARTGDNAGAIADYDHALAVNPKNVGVLNNRGQLLYKIGNYPEALQSLNQALEFEPKHVKALTNRGLTKGKLGDVAGAEADVKFALATDSEYPAAQAALAEVQKQQREVGTAATAPTPAVTNRLALATPGETSNPGALASVAPTSTPAAIAPTTTPETRAAPPAATTGGVTVGVLPAGKSGFKLVAVERFKKSNEDVTYRYIGQGTEASLSSTSNVHEFSGELTWSVPSVLLSGVPARFRIAVRPRTGCVMHGSIHFGTEDSPEAVFILAGVRFYNVPPRSDLPPNAPTDEFDLVLPDISRAPAEDMAGRNPTYALRVRQQDELENIAVLGETSGRGPKIPSQLPLVASLVHSRFWLKDGSGLKEFRDVRISICDDAGNAVAIYTYRWAGGDSGAVDSSALEVQFDPADKTDLRADGRDRVVLRIRVKPTGTSGEAAAARATETVAFAAEGENARWVDLSASEMRDGWKVIAVQASNPDPVRGPRTPPAILQVRARATEGERQLTRLISISVPPEPILDATPDAVEFTAQSGSVVEVKAAIENAGPDPWKFRAEYAARNRSIATFDVTPVDGKSAVLKLKEAGLDPLHDGSNDERAVLRLLAEQSDRAPLEREIKVAVAQEGLFVSGTGRDPNEGLFRLHGDGSGRATEIEFRIFALDPATRKMINLTRRAETLKAVTVEGLDVKGRVAANVLEVGQLTATMADIRGVNEPAGVLRLTLAKEVPGDGRIIPCEFRITYGGRSEEAFSAIVRVGVVMTNDGPGSNDWQVELARCQEIINKFVPAAYYPKMQAMLDQRKMTLGAQGLYLLRQKIWRAAVELTLGEGGRGYANEAAWAGAITDALEWAQWAGDMAFGAVIGTMTGPYGAMGASSLKTAVISALTAYQEGRGVDEWLWENFATIPGMLEGKIIDVDTFEKLGVESKAKAWALFIAYHFGKNLYNGATVVDALTNTAKAVGGDVLSTWLGAEVRKSGHVAVSTWAGQKGQEVSEAAGSLIPKTPDSVASGPLVKAPGPLPAPVAKAPAKTVATSPAPKAPAAADAAGSTKVAGQSETAKMPDATAAMPKVGREPVPKVTEVPPSTKVAGEDSGASPPTKATGTEETLSTKPGAETESKVAKTGADAAASAKQAAAEGAGKTPAKGPAPVESNASGRVRSRMSVVGGKPYANRDDVLAIMRDPSMVRSLKNAPPQVQEAFSNTREAIYKQHDALVAQYVKDHVPGMKYRFVKVMEFRTPGATGPSLNTDRDYRVCYWTGRDPKTGQDIWAEVKRSDWEDTSYRTFARLTGGPSDTAEAAMHWAEQHQQLATDAFHKEASPDFADQKMVWNEKTKKFEKTQVVSNITAVKDWYPGRKGADGKEIPPPALLDPQALGQMYRIKVGDARFTHEKFVQAQKAVKDLDALFDAYQKQGRRVGVLPPAIVEGMSAVLAVNKQLAADPNRRDAKAIAEANRILQANRFANIDDFVDKLSGQFESLKLAR